LQKARSKQYKKPKSGLTLSAELPKKKDRKQGGKIEKTAPLQSLSAEREKGVEGGSMGGEGADWMGALM